jgi:hypothetical protein
VNEAVTGAPGDLAININERPATFVLSSFPFGSDVIYQMAPRTFDLLLLAASVFTADSLIPRGGSVRSDLGADWVRDLEFVLPVSDPAFWDSVSGELVQLLSFLTGDRFAFRFVHRERKLPKQPGLGLAHGVKADQVLLLSGGLDSLTGTIDVLTASNDNILLVTHCSASKTMAVQKRLARELFRLFPRRITWVPARGHLIGVKARETTQRSRSFLYGALGYAAASLVGVSRVSFHENGIVSLNLPISRQVVGSMATRTTHPLFLRRLGELLSKVANRPFTIDNPYAWLTKTQVLERLGSLGRADLIGKTTSCSSVRPQTKAQPLCGCCSQCLDRRFAVLAADVTASDPGSRYKVDLFLGVREDDEDRTMAHDWTRKARELATMTLGDVAARFGAELADVATGYPDRPAGQVMAEAFQMYRRHGIGVDRVAKAALNEMADHILSATVPAGSLLAAILTSGVRPEPEAVSDVAGSEDEALPDSKHPIFPLRLVFDPDAGPFLRIKGLSEFRGAHLGLVGRLKPYLEADVDAQRAADDHKWVPPGLLGDNKAAVRQHAKRCRDGFADEYEVVEGSRPDSHILVHSKGPKGYRLDPEARFVDS